MCVISKEKSDIGLLMNELSSLKETINNMSDKIQFLETEITKLNTNSTPESNVERKETNLVVEEQSKCDMCDFDCCGGQESLKFHKKWVHFCDNIHLEFKCRVCEFISNSASTMKSHIISKHKIPKPNAGDFTCTREPMCETCIQIENLNPAVFEWPSFTMLDKLKCEECLNLNLYWWTVDCQRPLPEDVLHLGSLEIAIL